MESPPDTLEVCELFESIAGETTQAGRPAVFVRLAGCNLRCAWCDTPHSWEPGTRLPAGRLLQIVSGRKPKLVVITGGEPLLQPATVGLVTDLLAAGRQVQVETNGSLDVGVLPAGAWVAMDLKPPSSGQHERMDLANLARLRPGDDLKIVVQDRADFDWLADLLARRPAPAGVNILLSPAFPSLSARVLADWLLDSGLPARIQLQLHRLIWPDGADGRPLGF